MMAFDQVWRPMPLILALGRQRDAGGYLGVQGQPRLLSLNSKLRDRQGYIVSPCLLCHKLLSFSKLYLMDDGSIYLFTVRIE